MDTDVREVSQKHGYAGNASTEEDRDAVSNATVVLPSRSFFTVGKPLGAGASRRRALSTILPATRPYPVIPERAAQSPPRWGATRHQLQARSSRHSPARGPPGLLLVSHAGRDLNLEAQGVFLSFPFPVKHVPAFP